MVNEIDKGLFLTKLVHLLLAQKGEGFFVKRGLSEKEETDIVVDKYFIK